MNDKLIINAQILTVDDDFSIIDNGMIHISNGIIVTVGLMDMQKVSDFAKDDVIDAKGNIAMPFNTEGMYRASKSSNGEGEISIYK